MDLNLVTIRFASNNDYNAILDINRSIYDKFDYLPALFKEWSNDPHCYHFVAEYQGNIIGYSAAYFNDQTCLYQYLSLAGRIHLDYQRSGVYEKLRKYANGEMKKLTPPGKFGMRSAAIATPNMIRTVESDKTIAVIMYWYLSTYEIKVTHLIENLYKLSNKTDNSKAVKLPNEEAISIVTSEKSVVNLQSFAPFILTSMWMVYKINKHNLRLILSQNHSVISVDKDGICTAISTNMFHITIDNNIRLDIWYHGKAELELWASHTVNHLQHSLKVVPKDKLLRVMIHTPDELSSEGVLDFLRPVFGERFSGETFTIPRALVCEKMYRTDEKTAVTSPTA